MCSECLIASLDCFELEVELVVDLTMVVCGTFSVKPLWVSVLYTRTGIKNDQYSSKSVFQLTSFIVPYV